MGIMNITNACSHLQNSSRARLGLTSIKNTKYNLRLALAMHRAGLLSSVTRGGPSPPPPEALLSFEAEPVTTANVSSRRIWLGLKYWDNKPVINNVKAISTPKRPVNIQLHELQHLTKGFRSKYLEGLNLGELIFLSTPAGVLEGREAIAKKVGGLVLCRVS